MIKHKGHSTNAMAIRLLQMLIGLFLISTLSPSYAAENEKVKLCIACHSKDIANASFAYPDLNGLHPEYIIKQMKDFKSNKRASLFMGPLSTQVEDKDLEAIANYFSALPRIPDNAVDQNLAKQGEKIFNSGFPGRMDACTKCHGNEGEGTAKYPRINAQHPQYLVQELKRFKSGERNNDANEEMRKIARQLNEAEMSALAQYITGLKEEELQE